jgi:hypothetical protein
MRKQIIMVLALLALVLPAQAGDQDFQLFNRTGVDIHALYVAPADSDDWGEDLLGGAQLIAGADVLIVFDPSTEAEMWDIRVEDAEGNSLNWADVDLIMATQVILEDNGVARIK